MTNEKNRAAFWASLVVILVLIPAVFLISFKLGDRRYYVASVIIMILAMVPFFVNFETNRPDSRYLATIAVMTVIAIVSRLAFAWAPNFKPTAGIIIITAIAFGPQSGFMTGALAMIASNIVFGQGPWTPWQMFAYGMIGFIAGILGKYRILSDRHALRSAVISFFLVFILSGAVLDTCSVFLMLTTMTKASVAAIYLAGVPVNISNALCSSICVFLLVKPINAALNRLKVKYGIKF